MTLSSGDHENMEVAEEIVIDAVNESPEKSETDLLKERIKQLEIELKKSEQEKIKLNAIVERVKLIFNDDQIERLMCPGSRKPWSNKTLQECILDYYRLGTSQYNYLRDKGYPMPSARTLQKHLMNINCEPGTQHDLLKLLKKKVQNMKPQERFTNLAIDEMAIMPKLQFDSSTQAFMGYPTVPPSHGIVEKRQKERDKHLLLYGTEPEEQDILAKHAFNVLLCGLVIRYKQLIGYHFSENGFDPDFIARWIRQLVKEVSCIGLVVTSITTDQGGGNLPV